MKNIKSWVYRNNLISSIKHGILPGNNCNSNMQHRFLIKKVEEDATHIGNIVAYTKPNLLEIYLLTAKSVDIYTTGQGISVFGQIIYVK